jgi:hypothetical protein
MKVYITATPKVSKEIIENVYREVNQINGDITFELLTSLTSNQYDKLVKTKEITKTERLTFNQLFNICDGVRLINDLVETDTVVLLTSERNVEDWFSANRNNNIFIDTNDWEKHTSKDPRYGVAYQIIENLFQLLLGIDCDIAKKSRFVHKKSIGCINDFCDDKNEVILKLRTAEICEKCLDRAKELKIKKSILLQIINTLEHIRNNIRSVIAIGMIEPETVIVDKNCKVTIGQKTIDPPGLPKTLFVFFLNEINGVKLNDLSKHSDRLIKIYHKIKPTGDESSVIKMATPYFKKYTTFSKYKTDLNKYLITELGDRLADYYVIQKEKNLIFKIRIEPKYLNLNSNF